MYIYMYIRKSNKSINKLGLDKKLILEISHENLRLQDPFFMGSPCYA